MVEVCAVYLNDAFVFNTFWSLILGTLFEIMAMTVFCF